jgi:hypothetical protein
MKTDIEYAAMVMGTSLVFSGAHASIKTEALDPYLWPVWRPEHDDGDSRRLEAACMKWCHEYPFSILPIPVYIAWEKVRDARRTGDLVNYRVAVHELAVEIGRVIDNRKVIDGGGV